VLCYDSFQTQKGQGFLRNHRLKALILLVFFKGSIFKCPPEKGYRLFVSVKK